MALTKVGRSLLNTGVADSSDATAITISSAEDATFAGHVLLADSKNLKIGAGTDLQLYHDGSNSYITNSTGALKIATETSGVAVTIGHTTSETTIADNLTVTGTIASAVITADGLDMGDSEKIRLGASQDLEIYHDGSHSYVYDGGTGNIVLKTNNGAEVDVMGGSEYMAKFIKDGAVELYYDDSKKIETTSAGATVTGTLTATLSGNVTGNLTGTADVATAVTITDNESTDEDNAIIFTAGGDVDGGNLGLESDGTLTYNPSTGTVTATTFVGALTGNASGTAATVTGAAQTNITSLGTLTGLTGGTGDLIWDTPTFVVDSSADKVGIGTTAPDSKLHVLAASAGTVDANAAAQLVIENSGDTGINLLSPNDQDNWILFGDPDDNFIGGFRYRHSTDALHFYAGNTDHMTLGSDGLLTVNEGAMIAQGALTSSSNAVAWNANTAANAYHVTTENTTISAPSNATEGQIISIEIAQGGTARTIAWNTVFEFADSTAPTMTATANKTDIYSFRYNGSVWQEIGRVQNMAQT